MDEISTEQQSTRYDGTAGQYSQAKHDYRNVQIQNEPAQMGGKLESSPVPRYYAADSSQMIIGNVHHHHHHYPSSADAQKDLVTKNNSPNSNTSNKHDIGSNFHQTSQNEGDSAAKTSKGYLEPDAFEHGLAKYGILDENQSVCLSIPMDWSDFVDQELDGVADDLWHMVVLSGQEHSIWAGSIGEYVQARWPQEADFVKRVVLSMAGSDTFLKSSRLQKSEVSTSVSAGYSLSTPSETNLVSNIASGAKVDQSIVLRSSNVWTLNDDSHETTKVSLRARQKSRSNTNMNIAGPTQEDVMSVSISGTKTAVVEALAWTFAVLQSSDGDAFPFTVQARRDSDALEKAPHYTLSGEAHESYSRFLMGTCWVPLLPRAACAANFVSPFSRPESGQLCGIELSFDLMCMLCGLYFQRQFDGGWILSGDNGFVYPMFQHQNCVQWHFQPGHLSAEICQSMVGQRLIGKDLEELRNYTRHFLGLWSDPEITLGTESSDCSKLKFSAAEHLESTCIRDSFAVGGTLKLPQVISLTGSVTYKVAKKSKTQFLLEGPISDQLYSKISSPVLLYSPSEKRAWLVSFVSVVFHLARCRAFARSELNYHVPPCEKKANGGRAAWRCLKSHHTDTLRQPEENERLTEDEMKYTIAEHMNEIMACMQAMKGELFLAKGFFRDQILGYELAALAKYKDAAPMKKHGLGMLAEGWGPLVDQVEAVFFYEGLSDPIVPSEATKAAWSSSGASEYSVIRSVPTGLNLLVASLPCLLSIADEQGHSSDGALQRLTQRHTWFCPTGSNLYGSCGTGPNCNCDHLQQLTSTIRKVTPPKILFAEPNEGAVMFKGNMTTRMTDVRASLKNTASGLSVVSNSSLDVDSGYISHESREPSAGLLPTIETNQSIERQDGSLSQSEIEMSNLQHAEQSSSISALPERPRKSKGKHGFRSIFSTSKSKNEP